MNQPHSRLLPWIALAVLMTAACHDEGVLAPVGCGGAPGQIGQPAVVRAVHPAASPHVGDTVEVVVTIEGATNVGSVPFRLRFSTEVLEFAPPAEEGSFMSCDGSGTAFLADGSTSPGEIVVALSRLGGGAGASGAGELATFRFTAVRAGRAIVAFTGASVRDPESGNLPASFLGATIAVDPAP